MLSSIFIFLRGVLMGIADSIPGVSGGTVAMIVGIYERLVLAISSFDTHFLSLLFGGKIRQALKHVQFGFLGILLLGIVVGLGSSAVFMHQLLRDHLPVTFGAFMGMILASVVILFHQIKNKTFACGIAVVLGTIAAWLITTLNPMAGEDSSLLYIFCCGLVAICAMILPGISGSYILLILGEYAQIIARVKDLAHLKTTPGDFLTLCVFGAGCVLGLLAFSRLLKFLLKHYHGVILSLLIGFMLGSIACLWPFQRMTLVGGHMKFERLAMSSFSTEQQIYVLCALLAGLVGVLVLERIASIISVKSKRPGTGEK